MNRYSNRLHQLQRVGGMKKAFSLSPPSLSPLAQSDNSHESLFLAKEEENIHNCSDYDDDLSDGSTYVTCLYFLLISFCLRVFLFLYLFLSLFLAVRLESFHLFTSTISTAVALCHATAAMGRPLSATADASINAVEGERSSYALQWTQLREHANSLFLRIM